jgi:hypothetical protein
MMGRSRGSISLEAVLVLPVLLIICWFMLSQIIAVTAEIKLGGAVRRTAAEMSLLGPAARLLETAGSTAARSSDPDVGDTVQDVETLFAAIFPGLSAEQLLYGFTLDIASTHLIGPAVLSRVSFWLDDAEAGQPGTAGNSRSLWRHSIRDLHVFLDWQLGRQQLWLCVSWQQQHALGLQRRTTCAVVPLWTGHDDQRAAESNQDSIWLLDNFTRGQTFREQMGATLPYDFPVIATFESGTATAIKSMDLTAPTYAGQSAFSRQVSDYIEAVAGFAGADYNKGDTRITIGSGEITGRRLLLVIPQNSGQNWLDASLAELGLLAAGSGVDLQVVRTGISTRYQQESPDGG